jgi:glycerol-3-phosphate dehydrogenase
LDVLLRAHSFGAVVANHVRGEGFETSTGPMHAVRAIDEVGHRQLTIRARSLVDASGVWTGTLDGTDRPPRLRPSKGVHLVVPAARLPLLSACVFPAPDGREVFAAPDGPTTIFGTTDTEYDGPLDAPFVDGADVEYLLGAVNGAFRADLQPDAVIAAWAGLRPLIDDGRSSVERTRHSRVTVSSSRVVTVTGGKLTVFLSMAEQATDAVCELLGERRASHVPFGDGELGGPDPYARVRAEGLGLDEHQVDLLVARYGERAVDVLKLWADEPHLTRSSADATDTLRIEAVWAVRHEMAVHLEDVISRRLRLATGELDAGLGTRIPSVVARERGWSREETARQIDACARSIAHERGPSLRPPRPDPGGRGSGAEPPHPGSGESPG